MFASSTDLIVFSSRPFGSTQVRTSEMALHFAEKRRVYFFANPVIGLIKAPTYHLIDENPQLTIVQPHLPSDISVFEKREMLIQILRDLVQDEHLEHYGVWTDTARAMSYIRYLTVETIVFDKVQNEAPELTWELEEYADVILNKEHDNKVLKNHWDFCHYFSLTPFDVTVSVRGEV